MENKELVAQASPNPIEVGATMKAKIVEIGDEYAFLEFAKDMRGKLDCNELKRDGGLIHNLQDEIEVEVVDPCVSPITFSLKQKPHHRKGSLPLLHLKELMEKGEPVDGLVETYNKGGYEVRVGNFKAFCPFSQMYDRFYDDKDQFLGRKMAFFVTEVHEKKQRVVLSRRPILQSSKKERMEDLHKLFERHEPLTGRVTKIEDFGAFVDLGGDVEGLLHVSEISHARVEKPGDRLHEGDEIQVLIINIKDDEKNNSRISLSMRSLEKDNWKEELPFSVGDTVSGTVIKVEAYGAFVELGKGLDGLVHISELSDEFVCDPEKSIEVGERIDVKVIRIDQQRKRISLSIKELKLEQVIEKEVGSFTKKKLRIGERYLAIVGNVKLNGLFVMLPEVSRDTTGFIPLEELGLPKGADIRKEFTRGKTLTVALVASDERGRNRLSVKAMQEQDAENEYKQYIKKMNKNTGSVTLGDLFPKKS